MGIKLFNSLPLQLKLLHNNFKLFKSALKDFFIVTHFIPWRNILIMVKRKIWLLYEEVAAYKLSHHTGDLVILFCFSWYLL
jgi:hypothetical protein